MPNIADTPMPDPDRTDDEPTIALRQWFGFQEFRPGQRDVIDPVLRGESVLAMLPTGAGKSLCYQLPAMLLPGTTLVISPLIALMKDQIDSLPPAVREQSTLINSTLDPSTLAQRAADIAAGRYKLVYAAPERLRQRPFLHALSRANISLIVIDEAHCISMWGNDFRPDYLFIAKALPLLDNPPVLAMSATLTPSMRSEINRQLGRPLTFVTSGTFRPNLRMEVRTVGNEEERLRLLVDLCRQEHGCGIVYARSRDKCEVVAGVLRRNNIPAAHYHAGMESEARAATQDAFMHGGVRVIVATVAFGMGVDKANVRYVVHYNLPNSLEGYYQEAGRAGRDGELARCILFYSRTDKNSLTRWLRDDHLSVEDLRRAFAGLRQLVSDSAGFAGFVRANGAATGLVTLDDLYRYTELDETRVRVAISMLERVGLVERHFDLPRNLSVTLLQNPADSDDEWANWARAAQLRAGRNTGFDSLSLCDLTKTAPEQIEEKLLLWSDQNKLQYTAFGRDILITLHSAPAGLREEIARLLDQYEQTQLERIEQIASYATARRCRHGMIARHFGSTPMQRCNACDYCSSLAGASRGLTRETLSALSRERSHKAEQELRPRPEGKSTPELNVLQCLREMPWQTGRTGLVRALRGSITSKVSPSRCPSFGVLSDMSEGAIIKLVERLIDAGYIDRDNDGEYRFLSLTRLGRDALDEDWLDLSGRSNSSSRSKGHTRTARKVTPDPDQSDGGDPRLLQALFQWNEQVAQEKKLPSYCILNKKTIYELTRVKPRSRAALSQITGIGPAKLADYGTDLLKIIAQIEDD